MALGKGNREVRGTAHPRDRAFGLGRSSGYHRVTISRAKGNLLLMESGWSVRKWNEAEDGSGREPGKRIPRRKTGPQNGIRTGHGAGENARRMGGGSPNHT
jgi:hypothetical protein